ncbi:ferroptosis suppressor protein 1-like [Myxocyprinus asiaticus]|uniref:ferroptosis suppressor protein 1-like n=1 Tax=Myxocyprinus asiaticus TaxID=70543 RepID=UPI002223C126|nr:ferroptosis suppressor protein 1-like [Myxocyprinus asiaticus]XP_051506640.1 ferroptosis suppressor protein 1-like [Myxocyprinus asiaticus]
MGGQLSIDQNVHVVIVGGGFGGIAAAQHLKHHGVPFMLIDVLDAFHHNVAALRASVQNGFAKQTFIPYKETFGLNFLQGRVIRIDTETKTVVLDNGKEVRYSHLILCTGTNGPFPGKHNSVDTYQSAIQKYEDFVKEVQAANTVLVVGGGSTGVEMAAELRTEFTNKKVILIHSREDLADPELLPSVKKQAKQVLLEKGVELLLGQKVSNLDELELNVCQSGMVIKTSKNEQITADLVICCTGNKINSEAYSSSLSACLAANGALKVNKHLQVEGFDNVYAVGDCANVNEPKMAYHAGLHAGVAASNIINSLSGKALTSYHPGNVTMLLAMGRDDGVGQFNGYKLPRFLVTKGKSQGLLLWKSWKEMGQKAPN